MQPNQNKNYKITKSSWQIAQEAQCIRELKITHVKILNNWWHIYSSVRRLFCKVFLVYSPSFIRVCMECGYTNLNHNLLVSTKKKEKKSGQQGREYKGGFTIFHPVFWGLFWASLGRTLWIAQKGRMSETLRIKVRLKLKITPW